jgi:hypothetical protein
MIISSVDFVFDVQVCLDSLAVDVGDKCKGGANYFRREKRGAFWL